MYEHKDFKFSLNDVKADADDGTFTGYASIFGVKDSWGDVVMPGAFKRTIKAHKGMFPLLWYHDVTQPLGNIEVEEDDKGLKVKHGELNLDVKRAQETYSLMKMPSPPVKGLSIGYETIKENVTDDERQLKEIGLWEISLLVFQACPGAEADNVKAARNRTELLVLLDDLLRKDKLNQREQQFVRAALGKLAQMATEEDLVALMPVGTTGDDDATGTPPTPEPDPQISTQVLDGKRLNDIKTALKELKQKMEANIE